MKGVVYRYCYIKSVICVVRMYFLFFNSGLCIIWLPSEVSHLKSNRESMTGVTSLFELRSSLHDALPLLGQMLASQSPICKVVQLGAPWGKVKLADKKLQNVNQTSTVLSKQNTTFRMCNCF